MNQKILVINGPNLNLLGTREKEKYGQSSLEDIRNKCEAHAKKIGIEVEFKQSNVEGEIVNFIQETRKKYNGITNIYKREDFRHKSLISKAADGIICGLGADGYIMALNGIKKIINNEN